MAEKTNLMNFGKLHVHYAPSSLEAALQTFFSQQSSFPVLHKCKYQIKAKSNNNAPEYQLKLDDENRLAIAKQSRRITLRRFYHHNISSL